MDTIPAATDKTRLFSKMAAIMGALSAIPKLGVNTYHNYKYVTASDVADAIREQMAAQNLAFFAETANVVEQGGRYIVEYLYTFACGDTGAVHTCRWFGEAIAISQKGAPDDKALTKAATTAQKYFLLKTFIVSTSDDPDLDHDVKPLVDAAKKNLAPPPRKRPDAAPPAGYAPPAPTTDPIITNTDMPYTDLPRWENLVVAHFRGAAYRNHKHVTNTIAKLTADGTLKGGETLRELLDILAARKDVPDEAA